MQSPTAALKAQLLAVIADRDAAEAEVAAASSRLTAAGVGMGAPLVDRDGFPRADVDVHAVRSDRHTVVTRSNDAKTLTKRADELLQQLHAAARAAGTVSAGAAPPRGAADGRAAVGVAAAAAAAPGAAAATVPFAVVRDVATGSPAAAAGLAVGDRVVRFGSVTAAAGPAAAAAAMAALPAVLAAAVAAGGSVEVDVVRDGAPVRATVAPREGWGGRGALGCHLVAPT